MGKETHLTFKRARVGKHPLQIRQSKCLAVGEACTFHIQFQSPCIVKSSPLLVDVIKL
jgi:hypothetical protein